MRGNCLDGGWGEGGERGALNAVSYAQALVGVLFHWREWLDRDL
jgi:hypothetical protein